MWDIDTHADNHFEMTMPLTPAAHRMLLVLYPDEEASVLPTFDSAKQVGTVTIPVGGHHTRTIAPLRCARIIAVRAHCRADDRASLPHTIRNLSAVHLCAACTRAKG